MNLKMIESIAILLFTYAPSDKLPKEIISRMKQYQRKYGLCGETLISAIRDELEFQFGLPSVGKVVSVDDIKGIIDANSKSYIEGFILDCEPVKLATKIHQLLMKGESDDTSK